MGSLLDCTGPSLIQEGLWGTCVCRAPWDTPRPPTTWGCLPRWQEPQTGNASCVLDVTRALDRGRLDGPHGVGDSGAGTGTGAELGLPRSPQHKLCGLAVAGPAFRDRSPCPAQPVPTQPEREAESYSERLRPHELPVLPRMLGQGLRPELQGCKASHAVPTVSRVCPMQQARELGWGSSSVPGSEHGPPAPSHGRAPLDTSQLRRGPASAQGLEVSPLLHPLIRHQVLPAVPVPSTGGRTTALAGRSW